MQQHRELKSLLEGLADCPCTHSWSIKLLSAVFSFHEADCRNWIEQFGDPLTSLTGAKAFVEQLALDWHEAMSIGALALEGRQAWLLPDLAPHAVTWAISQLLIDEELAHDQRQRLN